MNSRELRVVNGPFSQVYVWPLHPPQCAWNFSSSVLGGPPFFRGERWGATVVLNRCLLASVFDVDFSLVQKVMHMALTGKERRFLRGLGHHLTPVVQVGKEGVTQTLVAATNQALDDHELIKVKIGENSPLNRFEAAQALGEATHSDVAQVLGRTALLYRPDPDKPTIKLPKVGETKRAQDKASDGDSTPNENSEKHSPAPIPKRMKHKLLPHRSSNKALR